MPTIPLRVCALVVVTLLASFASRGMGEEPIFENVTEASGIGGGSFVAWADYDQDGHTDVVTGGRLYRNSGDGRFSVVESFAAGSHGAWGDFDNDGKLDFYALGGEGRLLRNLGDNKFEVLPIPANVHKMSRAAAWGGFSAVCAMPNVSAW